MQAAISSLGPLLGPSLRAAWAWQGPGKSAGVQPAPEPRSLRPQAAASPLILWLSTNLEAKGRQTASGWGEYDRLQGGTLFHSTVGQTV